MTKLPKITVHGRFQPPAHQNHWLYILDAFNRAEYVIFLITNPDLDDRQVDEAPHRSQKENNPFTYDERVVMFQSLLAKKGYSENRYSFAPFDIRDGESFGKLDKSTPNLINVYSPWSAKKVELFEGHGLSVVQTHNDETSLVSGSDIRRIIRSSANLEEDLMAAGFVPEALGGLNRVLKSRRSKQLQ